MLSYTGTWHPVGDNSESPPKSEGGPPKGPKGDNDKGEFAGNGPPKLVLGLSESGPEWEFILLCCSEGGMVSWAFVGCGLSARNESFRLFIEGMILDKIPPLPPI